MNLSFKYSLLFAIIGAIFFLPFLGGVHLFDWDEINFAEIAREMMVLDDYLRMHIDFKPFWEKPPLFIWLQSASMHILGINEYAARFPNALCGILTLIILFNLGRKLYNVRFGIAWAGAYFGSILPHLYFKSGIIDPWFNLFIFLGIYFMIVASWRSRDQYPEASLRYSTTIYIIAAGLLIGLAILTKGPVAYLIAALICLIYWGINGFRRYLPVMQFFLFTLISLVPMLAWYALQVNAYGPEGFEEFLRYQFRLFSTPDAGHKGFLGFHFVVLLVGCFPASIFAIRSFFKTEQALSFQQDLKKWMLILFWVVLILFSIVQSKIVHYSSLCYFPLTYLAALCIIQIIEGKIRLNNWMKASLMIVAVIYGSVTILAPFAGRNIDLLIPIIDDPFAVANLKASVHWTGWESLIGIIIILATAASIYLFNSGKNRKGFIMLFGGTSLYVMLTLLFFIGKIESYSQRAAIEFYKNLAGKDVYVTPWRYKSYAHLYYTKKQPPQNEQAYKIDWLLNGEIDKDVYFVAKVHQSEDLKNRNDIEEIGAENGFVFLRRKSK